MLELHTPPGWAEAAAELLRLAAIDLDAGATPAPTLLAFDGEEPLAMVTLRPFDRDELLQALLEVLALLLPLGADRIALTLPGRAWRVDEPVVAVAPDLDLRMPVVVLLRADGHGGPCTVASSVHPVHVDDDGWRWLGELPTGDGAAEGPTMDALALLVDARAELAGGTAADELGFQLARVLVRGHTLLLSPEAAARLEERAAPL